MTSEPIPHTTSASTFQGDPNSFDVAENPGFGVLEELPPSASKTDKRTHSTTGDSVSPSQRRVDPADSLGSAGSVSETDPTGDKTDPLAMVSRDYSQLDVPGAVFPPVGPFCGDGCTTDPLCGTQHPLCCTETPLHKLFIFRGRFSRFWSIPPSQSYTREDSGLVSERGRFSRFGSFLEPGAGRSVDPSSNRSPVVDQGVDPVGASVSPSVGRDDPESVVLRQLAAVGTTESPYAPGGVWSYADGENLGGRTFAITQNLYTSDGRELVTLDQVRAGVSRKGMTQWAWIVHDRDVYTEDDVKRNPRAVLGEPKATHVHIMVKRRSFASVGTIARAFGVPPQQVEVKPEGSFLDLVEYLTHENSNQQSKGKHLYEDDAVQANFDWRTAVDNHQLARSFEASKRSDAKRLGEVSRKISSGDLTLSEVRDLYPDLWASKGNIAHFEKLRHSYLEYQESPGTVINFYIFGPGGVGKDLMAKALARALFPAVESPYFKIGGENVSFERYDGEPVLIWEDYRVQDLLRATGSRSALFRVLGPYREPREAPVVNVKHGRVTLLNQINIVTGPLDFKGFLDGLAGEYTVMTAMGRVVHKAENYEQGYRRFPIVIPMYEGMFGIYINKGVLNGTREYLQYEKYEGFRQQLGDLRRELLSISDVNDRQLVIDRIESKTVKPIMAHVDRVRNACVPSQTIEDVLEKFSDSGEIVEGKPVEASLDDLPDNGYW